MLRSASVPITGRGKALTTPGRQRFKARGFEPSMAHGNPDDISLPAEGEGGDPYAERVISPKELNPHNTSAAQLEALDKSTRLAHWMNAFAADEETFASKAVFVEMRLRQALSSSISLGALEGESREESAVGFQEGLHTCTLFSIFLTLLRSTPLSLDPSLLALAVPLPSPSPSPSPFPCVGLLDLS